MKSVLWVVYVSPGSSFYFLSFSSSYCAEFLIFLLPWVGAPLKADFRGCWYKHQGMLLWLKDSLLTEKQTNKTNTTGYTIWILHCCVCVWRESVAGFPPDCDSAHRPQPWNKPSEMPTSVMMTRFSSTTSRSTPCGRRLKRQRGAWRGHPMTAGSWWLPSRPWGTSWTGIIASSKMKATGEVGVSRAHGHRATYLFHVFPCASSRL